MYEGGGGEDLRKKAHDASVELNYTLHYPRGERYISLFKDPGSNTDAIEKRDMIKKDIERRMEKGTLGARTTDPVEQDEEVKEEEEDEDRKTTKKVKSKSTKENKKIKRKVEPEKVKAETIENDGFFEF
jgi:hypothetical protein